MTFDPSIGRWIEEDPSGFKAGDDNLYRYVKNSPANFVDPTGLEIAGPRYNPYSTPWYTLTEASARATLERQIEEWNSEHYFFAAHLLEHFLGKSGTDYTPGDEDRAEAERESQPLVSRILLAAARHLMGNAEPKPVPVGTELTFDGPVRWTEPWTLRGLGDRIHADETFVNPNDLMFFTYGGAHLELHGTVTQFSNPYHLGGIDFHLKVSAEVTLSDLYDFQPPGPLNVRNWYSAYEAANFLQMKRGYPTFRHTLSFRKTYSIDWSLIKGIMP
jgi:hypothetical protein